MWRGRCNTYHKLALSAQGAGMDPLKAVVHFSLVKHHTVDVCSTETDGGEHVGIECSLQKTSWQAGSEE